MQLLSIPALACTALLFLANPASAQRTVDGDLQQQMSASEFKAAGLDKLSADELNHLNRWLQGTLQSATTQAVEAAREEGRNEVILKHRGFLDFDSREPITATLSGEFSGFGKGRVYTLDNGQQWEQTDATTVAGVRRDAPGVSMRPGVSGAWYMKVDGVNTQAKVKRIK